MINNIKKLVVYIVVVSEVPVLHDVLPDLAGVHPRHKVLHVPNHNNGYHRGYIIHE